MGTFKQYAKKSWKERAGRMGLASVGLAPLMEGASVWTGKEDPKLIISSAEMYAGLKAIEIGEKMRGAKRRATKATFALVIHSPY